MNPKGVYWKELYGEKRTAWDISYWTIFKKFPPMEAVEVWVITNAYVTCTLKTPSNAPCFITFMQTKFKRGNGLLEIGQRLLGEKCYFTWNVIMFAPISFVNHCIRISINTWIWLQKQNWAYCKRNKRRNKNKKQKPDTTVTGNDIW